MPNPLKTFAISLEKDRKKKKNWNNDREGKHERIEMICANGGMWEE